MSNSLAQRLGWVLWPSFLMACVAELAFFALFDPTDLHLFGVPIEAERMPIYTVGFFAFWIIGAVSSATHGLPGAVAVRGQPLHAGTERASAGLSQAVRGRAESRAPSARRTRPEGRGSRGRAVRRGRRTGRRRSNADRPDR